MVTAKQQRRLVKKARRDDLRQAGVAHDCTLVDVICDGCGHRQRNRQADSGWIARQCQKSNCVAYTGVYA